MNTLSTLGRTALSVAAALATTALLVAAAVPIVPIA